VEGPDRPASGGADGGSGDGGVRFGKDQWRMENCSSAFFGNRELARNESLARKSRRKDGAAISLRHTDDQAFCDSV